MKERLLKIARFLAYPAVYVFCLALFGYLTFPIDRLKDRIIAEFDRTAKPGQRLEIDKLDTYWFSGVAVTGMRLTLPPDEPSVTSPQAYDYGGAAPQGAAPPPAKDAVIVVDEGHARVRLLPLLLGRVRVDFWASVLGGEVKGTVPVGSAGGDVELEVEKIEIGKLEPITQAIGLPIKGTVTGKLQISAVDGKFAKASGALDLSIADIVVGDGKSKIAGLLELPAAKVGTLTLNAEAKEGVLKITKLTATGVDLELVGDGRISMREPAGDSSADLYLKFKFTDAYRGKNDTTKSLLGDPGSSLPGLMEMQVPKMKKAKRPDDFYGWHVYGPLKKLKFDPSATDISFAGPAPGATGATGASKATPRKALDLKKPGGLTFPLGGSQAKPSHDDDTSPPTPPPPQPVITPPTRVTRPEIPEIKLPEVRQPEPKQPERQPERQPDPPPPPPPPPEQPAPEQPAPEQPAPEQPPQ